MVADPVKEQTKRFSTRLNHALTLLDAPQRGRPVWLQEKLKNAVSYEQCRKYLVGLDFPSMPLLSLICERLGISIAYLFHGEGAPLVKGGQVESQLGEIMETWVTLDDGGRKHVVEASRIAKRAALPALQPAKRAGNR